MLITALVRLLPSNSSAVLLALPGSSFAGTLQAVAPQVLRHEVVSPGLIDAHEGLLSGFVNGARWPTAGRQPAEALYSAQQHVGGRNFGMPLTTVKFAAFADFLAQLANPSLLYLGPAEGHEELVISALAQILAAGTITWIDLPRDGGQQCRRLLDAVPSDEFEVYGLSKSASAVLAGQFNPDETKALLFLPKWRWHGFGLARLATGNHRITRDLVVPASQRASAAVLDKLHAAMAPIAKLARPTKQFQPALSGVFVSHASYRDGHGNENSLMVKRRAFDLTFAPPAEGTYDLGVVVNYSLNEKALKHMNAFVGGHMIGFTWDTHSWQFRSNLPLVIQDSHRPVTLRFEQQGDSQVLGIKGLELRERVGLVPQYDALILD